MTLTTFTLYAMMPLLAVGILLAFWRLVRGPGMADRVISLDVLITLGIGMIAAYSIATNQHALLDVMLVLVLISFLGTTAFAFYLQERGRG
jgi:multicomponent Na+:H+ antiporter subunit F